MYALICKATGGFPPDEIEKVVETSAVRLMLAIKMAIEIADIASSPAEGYEQNQGLEVLEVIANS